MGASPEAEGEGQLRARATTVGSSGRGKTDAGSGQASLDYFRELWGLGAVPGSLLFVPGLIR